MSSPSSARPICCSIVATYGNARISSLIRLPTLNISSNDVPGSALLACTTKCPSSNSGMNWPPSDGSQSSAAMNATTSTTATVAKRSLTQTAARACARRSRAIHAASARCDGNSSAPSAGVTVSAVTSDASTAAMNASASGPMNSPCTPEMKYTGTNSATTASVAKITGERISSDASRTTSTRGRGRRERRVLAQAAHDVLDVDDRVVDEHADRDREAAERHRVERVAEAGEHERRGDERQAES